MANVIELRLRVQDDGTAVVERFAESTKGKMRDVGASSGQAFETMEQGASKAQAAFAALASGISADVEKTNADFERLQGRVKLVGAALAGLGVAGGLGIASFADESASFSDALGQVDTLLVGTGTTIEQVKDQIRDLGSQYGSDRDQALAFYQAVSAGADASADAIDVVRQASILAQAGIGEMTPTVQLLAKTTENFARQNVDAAYSAEVFNNVVNTGTTTIDEMNSTMGKLLATAGALNVPLADVGSIMAILSRTLGQAQGATAFSAALAGLRTPADQAEKALAAVGLTSERIAQMLQQPQGLIDILRIIQEEGPKVGVAIEDAFPEREALAGVDVLARSLGKAREEMTTFVGSVTEGGKATEAAGRRMASFDEQLKRLERSGTDARAAFFEPLSGIVGEAADSLSWLHDAFDRLPGPIRSAISAGAVLTAGLTTVAGAVLLVASKVTVGRLGWIAMQAVLGKLATSEIPAVAAASARLAGQTSAVASVIGNARSGLLSYGLSAVSAQGRTAALAGAMRAMPWVLVATGAYQAVKGFNELGDAQRDLGIPTLTQQLKGELTLGLSIVEDGLESAAKMARDLAASLGDTVLGAALDALAGKLPRLAQELRDLPHIFEEIQAGRAAMASRTGEQQLFLDLSAEAERLRAAIAAASDPAEIRNLEIALGSVERSLVAATTSARSTAAAVVDLGSASAATKQKLIELSISNAIDVGDVAAIRRGYEDLREVMVAALKAGKLEAGELAARIELLDGELRKGLADDLEKVSDQLGVAGKAAAEAAKKVGELGAAAADLDLEDAIKAGDTAKAMDAVIRKFESLMQAERDSEKHGVALEVALERLRRKFEEEMTAAISASTAGLREFQQQADALALDELQFDIENARDYGVVLTLLEEKYRILGSQAELVLRDKVEANLLSAEQAAYLFGLQLEKLSRDKLQEMIGSATKLGVAVNDSLSSLNSAFGGDFGVLFAKGIDKAVGALGKLVDGTALGDLVKLLGDGFSKLGSVIGPVVRGLFGMGSALDKTAESAASAAGGLASGGGLAAILDAILQILPDEILNVVDGALGSIGELVGLIGSMTDPLFGVLGDGLQHLSGELRDGTEHVKKEMADFWHGIFAIGDGEATLISKKFKALMQEAFDATEIDESIRAGLAAGTGFNADDEIIAHILKGFDPKKISNAFRKRIKEIDFPMDALSDATRKGLSHGERDVMITGAEAAAAFLGPTFGADAAAEIERQLTSVYGALAAAQGLHGRDAEVFIDQNVSATVIGMQALGMSADEAATAVLELGEAYGAWPGAVDVLSTINHELDQMGGAQGAVIDALGSAIGVFDRQAGRMVGQAGSIQQAWEDSGLPVDEFARMLREVISTSPGLAALGPALEPMIVALETGNVEAERLQATLDGFAATSTGIADAMGFLRQFGINENGDLRAENLQERIDALDRQIEQADGAGNRELVIRLTADRTDLEEQLAQAQSDLDLFNRALQEQLNDQLGVVRADDIITPEEAAGLVSIMQGALTEGGDALDESSRNLIRSIYSQLRFELGMTEDELLAMFSDTDLANIVEGVSFPVEEAADVNENLDGAGEGARTLAESLGLSSEDAAALNTALGSMAGTLTATSETAAGLAASFAGEGGVNPAVRELGATGVEQLGLFAAGITDGNTEAGYLDDTMLDLIGNQIDFGDEGERAMGRTEDGILDLYGPMDGYLERLREAFLLYDSLTGLTPPDPPDSPDTPDTKTRQVGRAPGREPGAYAYDFTPSLFSDANPPPSLITFGRVDASFPSAPSGLLATRDVAGATRSAGGSDDLSAAVREMREAAGQMRATASLLATTARAVADGADPRRIARDVATAIVDLDALEARPDGRIRERDLRP